MVIALKLNKISLKWKLFSFILIFAAVIIIVFCVFQILLLEPFYRHTKIEQTRDMMNDVYGLVDGSDIAKIKDSESNLYACLSNYMTDTESDVYIIERVPGQFIGGSLLKEPDDYVIAFPEATVMTAKTVNERLGWVDQGKLWGGLSVGDPVFYNKNISKDNKVWEYSLTKSTKDINDDIVYCQLVTLADQNNYMIIILSRLTPVQPAVNTLKTQLFYITGIVVLLSIVIALILSRVIAKPIVDISASAKSLAHGEYDIEFKGTGYREIAELNDTLNYTVAELKKTETLQRELLANISHDLRTPLTLITGYAEMIRDLPSENNPENIQVIVDEANRLSLLVSDLLTLSRISAQTEPLKISKFNLTETIRSVVNRQQKFVEHEAFKIVFTADASVMIEADQMKIEQVVYNFITNAINYSGKSRLIEVIQTVENNKVRISIKDYGIGIKQEELDVIWQRYYRVDKGHQRSTQGSGLGLSIIKGILEYHKFTYGVESVEGKGSTFWFEAPLK